MAESDPQLALEPPPGGELPTPPAPTSPPPTEPTPPPDLAAELEAERARRADLEARLARLESERPAATSTAEPTRETPITPELVEQAFARGEITDAQRQQWHAKLAIEAAQSEQASRAAVQGASDRLAAALTQYPELRSSSSELFLAVNPEVHRLARELGLDARDVRVQALAVERVLAQRGLAMTAREADRTLRPVAGTPGGRAGAPAAPLKKEDPTRGVPPSMVQQWQAWGWSEGDVAEAAGRHRARMDRRRERFGAA